MCKSCVIVGCSRTEGLHVAWRLIESTRFDFLHVLSNRLFFSIKTPVGCSVQHQCKYRTSDYSQGEHIHFNIFQKKDAVTKCVFLLPLIAPWDSLHSRRPAVKSEKHKHTIIGLDIVCNTPHSSLIVWGVLRCLVWGRGRWKTLSLMGVCRVGQHKTCRIWKDANIMEGIKEIPFISIPVTDVSGFFFFAGKPIQMLHIDLSSKPFHV